jgi:hypothetical protein
MTETLYEIPEQFSAGTTVSYRRQLSDYPASSGWVLTAYLAGVKVAETIAVADGNDHVVTWAAADTDDLTAGVYHYVERVSLAGVARDVVSRYVTVLADIAAATAGSEQDWLERAVAALKAHIEGRLPTGMESYQIAGRAVSRMPVKEAVELLSTFEGRLARLSRPGEITRQVLIGFSPVGFDS